MPSSAFITAVQPNFDSGIAAVPTGDAAVPGASNALPLWLAGVSLANTNSAQRTVRITDGSGASIVPDVAVPGNSVVPIEWNLMPIVGLRWFASGAGVNGKAWGYQ
jgi:hypothetical protein